MVCYILSMKNRSALFILPIFSILLVACKGAEPLTLEERLHNAYLDSIEAKEENIRPLVNLTKEDKNVSWKDDKALLFTLHRYPSSCPEREEITITWSESWQTIL